MFGITEVLWIMTKSTFDKLQGELLMHEHLVEDVIVDQDVDFNNFNITGIGNIQFDTSYEPTGTETTGTSYWDADNHCVSTVLEWGVVLQNGFELYKIGTDDGEDFPEGTAVSAVGTNGNRTKFVRTDAGPTSTNSEAYVGLITSAVDSGNRVATREGDVNGINTVGGLSFGASETWLEDDVIYVDCVNPGYLTNVKPEAPCKLIVVGTVNVVHANVGKIALLRRISSSLEDLNDVDGNEPTTTGDMLTYNATTGVWDRGVYNITDYLTEESDPVFTSSQASNITETDITNLSNLSGTNTGDQDLSGYVPYTGATSNLKLGTKNISANKGTFCGDVAVGGFTELVDFSTGATWTPYLANNILLLDPYKVVPTYVPVFDTDPNSVYYVEFTDGAEAGNKYQITRTVQAFSLPQYNLLTLEGYSHGATSGDGFIIYEKKSADLTVEGDATALNLSGTNTGDENRASVQFTNLGSFVSTVSRRGRSEKAKSMTTYDITANASGSASVTVKKASYANYPSTLTTIDTITLTTAQKDTGAIAVSLDAGDYIIFELTSCSGITELLVEVY
jgi:hypothetical protein